MPRIPTYDDFQVNPQPLAAPRVTSEGAVAAAQGQGRAAIALGTGALNAGDSLVDLAVRIQERDNVEKVQAAQAAYGEQVLGWMQDAKANRVGHKAEGVTKDFDEWHAKTSSEISAGLKNQRQRKAFDLLARKAALASRSEIGGFELGEKKKAGLAAYNAANTNAVNTAATAASPELLALQRQNILNSIATQGAVQGWGEEETQAEKGKWLTALHLQRISNMVARNPTGAREYFEANKAEIDGTSHDAADKLLKTGEVKDGSLKLQFELQKLPGLAAQTKELDKRFKDGTISAEMRDATLTRLEHADARRLAARSEWEGNLLGAAADFHLKNPGKSVMDLPPAIYDGLKNSGKLAQAMNIFAGEVKSDVNTLLDLYETARVAPDEFRRLPLKTYIGSISSSDLEQLAKMQKDPKELKDAATLSEQLSDMHDQLGWGTGDREKKGLFDKSVREEIDLEQKRTGKVLNYEERQKVIDRMVVKGKAEGDWFRKFYFESKAKGKENTFVPDIPEKDKKDIQDRFFKKNKRNPTEQELLDIYRRWKGV